MHFCRLSHWYLTFLILLKIVFKIFVFYSGIDIIHKYRFIWTLPMLIWLNELIYFQIYSNIFINLFPLYFIKYFLCIEPHYIEMTFLSFFFFQQHTCVLPFSNVTSGKSLRNLIKRFLGTCIS
jgi:hypothetical protein